MKIKTLLLIAIIGILPFGAMADPHVGPVGNIEPVVDEVTGEMSAPANAYVATDDPLYAPAEITDANKTQIASTAYVKGAYNDTIAMVNKVSFGIASSITNTYNSLMHEIELFDEVSQTPVNIMWGSNDTIAIHSMKFRR